MVGVVHWIQLVVLPCCAIFGQHRIVQNKTQTTLLCCSLVRFLSTVHLREQPVTYAEVPVSDYLPVQTIT